MKRFIKFPDLEQFRHVIREVQRTVQYVGNDPVTGDPVFNPLAEMPVIHAIGTEKIHGTNAAVCYSDVDGFWVQKRSDICTIERDNAACALHAMQNQDAWVQIIRSLASVHGVNLETHIITVFYEWCGGNIQKRAAVSGLDKMAIIFKHFKVTPVDPGADEHGRWLPTTVRGVPVQNPDARIWNVCSFPTYTFDIDLGNPEASVNRMVDLVENTIEPNSPVGQYFGITGNIGEGIVVTFLYKDKLYSLKVKGEKHAGSKVKTLKQVDDAKLQHAQDVAQQVTPAWRLEQMFDLANDTINGGEPNVRNIGAFLKMVNTDIIKEDSDIIADAGLEPKDVFGPVARICKDFFRSKV